MRSRRALPGELCTCGRQAVEVFEFDADDGADGGRPPIGYCGIPDGGNSADRPGPCPFCGGPRHGYRVCPHYWMQPHPAWSVEAVVWQLAAEQGHDGQGDDAQVEG
jgi:hypothetical protein